MTSFSAPISAAKADPAPSTPTFVAAGAASPPMWATFPGFVTASQPASGNYAPSFTTDSPSDQEAWDRDWLFNPASPFGDGDVLAGQDDQATDEATGDDLAGDDLVLSGVALDA